MPTASQDAIHSLPLLISSNYLKQIESQLIQFQRQVALPDEPPPKPINWPLDISELLSLYHHIKNWMQTKNLSEIHIGQLLPSLEDTPIKLHKHLVLFWSEYFKQKLQYEKNPLNLSSLVSKETDSSIQFAGFIVFLFQKYSIYEIAAAGGFQLYFISQCFSLPNIQQTHRLLQELATNDISLGLKNIFALRYCSSGISGFEKYRLTGELLYYILYLVPDTTSTEDFVTELLETTPIPTDRYVWDKKNITHITVNKTWTSYPLDEINRIDTFLNSCEKKENSRKQTYVEMPYESFMLCIHKNSKHPMPTATVISYLEVSTLTMRLDNIINLYQLIGPSIIQSLISMVEPSSESEEVRNTLIPFFEKMSIKELRDCYATSIRHQCRGITVMGSVLSAEKSNELFVLCQQQPDIVSPWILLATSGALQKSERFSCFKDGLVNISLTPQCLIGLLSLKAQGQLNEMQEYSNIKRVYEYLIKNPTVYINHDIEFELDDDTQPNPFFGFMSEESFSISEAICNWLITDTLVLIANGAKINTLLRDLDTEIEKSLPLTIGTFDKLTSWYRQQQATIKFLSACGTGLYSYPKNNYNFYNLIITSCSKRDDFDLSSCLDIFCENTKYAHYPHPLLEQRCAQARVLLEYVLECQLVNHELNEQLRCKLDELIFSQPECLGFGVTQKARIKGFLAERLNQKTSEQLLALILKCIEHSANEPRAIDALHNIGMLLNEYKLEEIIRLKKISIWKLLYYLGYKDLSSKISKTRLAKLINLLKKEPINNTNYLYILNVLANTTLFNPEEKKIMSKRIFYAYTEGFVSPDIIDEVVSKLEILQPWISCAKNQCYQEFIGAIQQAYPLNQENLSRLRIQFQTYQTKLQRLAKLCPAVTINMTCVSLEELSFLILYLHIHHDHFNLYETLDILSGLTNCHRVTLLSKCLNSTYFNSVSSSHYFRALLQKDENQNTGLHLLLKDDPECVITILEKAEKHHKSILLKQTNASGESVWAMCVRLYAPMPIFQRISETLTTAQKKGLATPKLMDKSQLLDIGFFNKKKRNQALAIQETPFRQPSDKRQKTSRGKNIVGTSMLTNYSL